MKYSLFISRGFTLLLATIAMSTVVLLGQENGAPDREVVVERAPESGRMVIKIPAQDGKVAWEDVLRVLLRVANLEDSALKDHFPTGTLDLEKAYSRYTLLAVNTALAPDIRMSIEPATATEPAHLLVRVDEDAMQERARRLSSKLRKRVTGGPREGAYGLQAEEGWDATAPDQLLVVVLHGFNSSPQRFQPLVAALRGAGWGAAAYSYPDDQPIADSAQQLSADLKELAAKHPRRRFALITHSMGGLVARAALEQPELDPGNVAKLIMVAPPTHGSLLARFGFAAEVLDHLARDEEASEVTRFYAAVEDGLSEAKHDLTPNSAFLRGLNARSRNPRLNYSIFLGTGGRFSQDQLDRLRGALQLAADQSTTMALLAPQFEETLGDLDEVIHGKGDGVVAVKRGRLEGVTDTVLADFTHLGVLQTPDTFEQDPVFQGILKRLKQ